MKKLNLSRQLIIITLFSLLLMITLLTLVLPKALEPYFEQNVYTYLDKPLEVMHKDNEMKALDNIVYINNDNNELHITPNYKEVIDIDNENILLSYISNPKGKFKYKGKTYYYSTIRGRTGKGIAITNDFYIKTLRRNILFVTIPIVSIIFVIILVLLLCWSNYL